MNDFSRSNQVVIAGEIVSQFTYSHEISNEGFYMVDIKVKRHHNLYDIVPVMVSERLIDISKNCMGRFAKVNGQFRSYSKRKSGKNRLLLSVFVREISFVEEIEESTKTNRIYLDGYICKEPIYRKTPLGREITDLLIAVNRSHNKSDYIPCVTWEGNARHISQFPAGTGVEIVGRIQSREYIKKLEDGTQETRTAYEVSVSRIDVVESKENEDESRG